MPKSSRSHLDKVRAVVLERDANMCQRCGVDLVHKLASVHHRRPRGAGGSALVNHPANMVLVCGSATSPGCHRDIEVDRARAETEGWLIPKLNGVKPSQVPLLPPDRVGWVLPPGGDA